MLSSRPRPFTRLASLEVFLGSVAIFFSLLIYAFPQMLASPKNLVFLALMPVAMLFTLNISWSILFVISIANMHIYALGMHAAIYATYLIPLTFIFRSQRMLSLLESNPIRRYFLAYVILTLPSLANTPSISKSLFFFLNLVSVFILVELLNATIDGRPAIMRIAKVFLGWTTLNSLYILFQVIRGNSTGQRSFGFTGIVFVDFACVSILILFSYFVFANKKTSLWITFLLGLTFVGLVLTQTRNTLLSLFLSVATIVIYGLISPRALPISRSKLMKKCLLGMAVLLVLIGGTFLLKPEMFNRHKQLISSESTVKEPAGVDALAGNSIGTRLMIWITAANGFIKHPVVGIGAYSFGFNSRQYNILPKFLYEMYVDKLSPHVTYFAVLCETGIVGMAGFLALMFVSLRVSFRSLSLSILDGHKQVSLIILMVHLYVTYSMAFTDAWLWHQCAIVWGVILGVTVANHKILTHETAHRLARNAESRFSE